MRGFLTTDGTDLHRTEGLGSGPAGLNQWKGELKVRLGSQGV